MKNRRKMVITIGIILVLACLFLLNRSSKQSKENLIALENQQIPTITSALNEDYQVLLQAEGEKEGGHYNVLHYNPVAVSQQELEEYVAILKKQYGFYERANEKNFEEGYKLYKKINENDGMIMISLFNDGSTCYISYSNSSLFRFSDSEEGD